MKKVILVLFLFYAKTLSAQQLFYGASLGTSSYTFNAYQQDFNHAVFSLGFCTQYVFKDSSFGLEGNLSAAPAPIYGAAVNLSPYFFWDIGGPYSVFDGILKAGFFSSLYTHSALAQPYYDIGPSVGLNLFFRIQPTFLLGIDFSLGFGLNKYSLYEAGPLGLPPNPSYSSQLRIFNFSLKLMFS